MQETKLGSIVIEPTPLTPPPITPTPVEDIVIDAGQRAGRVLRELSEQLLEKAAEFEGQSDGITDRALRRMSHNIAKQPLHAVTLAAGAGLITGLLLARR